MQFKIKKIQSLALAFLAFSFIPELMAQEVSPLLDSEYRSRHERADRTRTHQLSHISDDVGRQIRNEDFHSMIEVGGGIESAVAANGIHDNLGGVNVLLKLQTQWGINTGDKAIFSQLVLLRLDAEGSIDPTNGDLAYFNAHFQPISIYFSEQDQNISYLINPRDRQTENAADFHFFTVDAHRDIRLGRDYRVSVSLAGIDYRHQTELNQNLDFILNISTDFIAARFQEYFSAQTVNTESGSRVLDNRGSTFQIAQGELEVGFIRYFSSRVSALSFRAQLSANAATLHAREVDPSGIASDQRASGELKLHLGRHLELFGQTQVVRISERINGIPGHEHSASSHHATGVQVMGGLQVRY
jgi:hypothetical protein